MNCAPRLHHVARGDPLVKLGLDQLGRRHIGGDQLSFGVNIYHQMLLGSMMVNGCEWN